MYCCNASNNNQPWPFGPSDGCASSNESWNQNGAAADQRRAARTGLAMLMLSGGTPMITGGDEHLRSLHCNNNAYNLDSPGNWLSYALDTDQTNFETFTKRMFAFRRAHPALRPQTWYSSSDTNGNGMPQLQWFAPSGAVADANYWNNDSNHAIAWQIDGTEFADPASAIYVAFNGWSADVVFTLPSPGAGKSWYRVTDTCNWADGPDAMSVAGSETKVGDAEGGYTLCGRAALLLVAK